MSKNDFCKYLLSIAHTCSDINQGALAATLPFLIAAHSLGYAKAAALVMVANLAGSLMQPLFGALADKVNKPWLIVLGLLLSGSGMSLVGFAPGYAGLCAAVVISGMGSAIFHPSAALLANRAGGANAKGRSMSLFSFGGQLGFTLGPLLATSAIGLWGLKGTLVFIVPQFIFTVIFHSRYADFYRLGARQAQDSKIAIQNDSKNNWSGFSRLSAVIFARSIVFHGLNTFLALYWIRLMGVGEGLASVMLSIYYALSAAGTLLGGSLADRYGCRAVVRISFATILPFLIMLAISENAILAGVLLFPLGLALGASHAPMVVLGQQYLPARMGFASGVTLGLAVSVGGIFAPVLGLVADELGLRAAFYVIASVAIIPCIVAFLLPRVSE